MRQLWETNHPGST